MRMGSGLRYNAPALRFNVGPSRFLALVVVGWAALGLLGLCAWALGGAGKSYAALMLAALLWLTVSVLALWRSMHLPQGVLLWDGHDWHLESLADRHLRVKSGSHHGPKPASSGGGRRGSRGRRR